MTRLRCRWACAGRHAHLWPERCERPKSSSSRTPLVELAAVFAATTPESIEAAKLLYLGVAFAVTWVVLAGYLFWIFRRQRRIEASLEKIRAQDNSEHPKLAADDKSPR